MKTSRIFHLKVFILVVKFSVYLNRRVFVMNNSGHKFEYKLKRIQPKQITEDDQEEPQSQNIAYQ